MKCQSSPRSGIVFAFEDYVPQSTVFENILMSQLTDTCITSRGTSCEVAFPAFHILSIVFLADSHYDDPCPNIFKGDVKETGSMFYGNL
jgi:hypothetical protein